MNTRSFLIAYRIVLIACRIAVGAVALAQVGCALNPSVAADASRPTVATENGSVSGFTKGGADVFLGLPFAAPPTGPLRWAPP